MTTKMILGGKSANASATTKWGQSTRGAYKGTYKQFLCIRDTRSKYMFNFPIKTCNEDTFLYYLARVLLFFTTRGYSPRILRSDYYTTFRSNKATTFYETSHYCTHESSAPCQQWQNAVERDVQTLLGNVSDTIQGQDFLRADTWAHALSHWTRLHNSLPHSSSRTRQPASSNFKSMPIINTASLTVISSVFRYKTTSDSGNSTSRTTSDSTWAMQTVVSKAAT
jgi:hypothetical protein